MQYICLTYALKVVQLNLTLDLLNNNPKKLKKMKTTIITLLLVVLTSFVVNGGEQGAKEKGKMRSEGKGYVLADGDVLHFLFNT